MGQLIKFISAGNPQATPARLAFFNYLQHFHGPLELVSADILEDFFSYCLDYPHWTQNKNQLGNEIKLLLQNWSKETDVELDFNNVRWPQDTQVIEIERPSDIADVLQNYLRFQCKKGEKFRLVPNEKNYLGIILQESGELSLQQFDHKFIFRQGHLEPLRPHLILHYNAQLELAKDRVQRLEIGPYMTAQFSLRDEGLFGQVLRGYACQRFTEINGQDLLQYPKLFYSIKRLEQHFVDRQTDSFYVNLANELERMTLMVQQETAGAVPLAVDLLAKAQNAQEYVFTDDKVLGLLIRDLQHSLTAKAGNFKPQSPQQQQPQKQQKGEVKRQWQLNPSYDLISSSPKADLHHEEPQISLLNPEL